MARLTDAARDGGGKVTIEQLHALAHRLNRMNWVKARSEEYFVNHRESDDISGFPYKINFLDTRTRRNSETE